MRVVTQLEKKWLSRKNLSVGILRTELLTENAVGNKHFKLSKNIAAFKQRGCKTLLSFGGAWSNHLHALSLETRKQGVGFVGVVRGDEGMSNELLELARRNGMQMVTVSRSEYRLRHDPEYCQNLCRRHSCDDWLPEGGSNSIAVEGCRGLVSLIEEHAPQTDLIALAVGTGATLAGIVCAAKESQTVVGLPVVRDETVAGNIGHWIQSVGGNTSRWRLTAPLKPGYAKVNDDLLRFLLRIYEDTGIVLDPVYTGKTLQHVLSPEFCATVDSDTQLLFVHTGGLLGCLGFKDQFYRCGERTLVEKYFSSVYQLVGNKASW